MRRTFTVGASMTASERARAARLVPAMVLFAFAVSACGERTAAVRDAAGLATVFDSSRTDSVFARVSGMVPEEGMRRLVEELRIAPTADDTSLFSEVFEFDVGTDGRLFVFDRPARAVLVFDAEGTLQRRVGREGAGPGEFRSNGGMVVLPDGRLAQWDTNNSRISFFSPDGDFLNSWTVPGGFSTNNGLRSDRSGPILWFRPVTAPREGEILGRFGLVRVREGGAIGDSLIPPDLPVSRITYVAREGGGTSATSPTHSPRFIWGWHPDGHFVSVATTRYEIEVSRADRPLRIVREVPAIPVSEDERAWDQEQITHNMRQTQAGWVWQGPSIPSEKPPVAGLSIARDGRIWVRVSTASQVIPEAERDEQRPNQALVRRYRDPIEYEVFESNGTFLGRLRLPARATFMEADGDRIWYLDRDADGLPAIVRARIEPALR
jgi:hypothetical protein